MPNYRRYRLPGDIYFLAINLVDRYADLLTRHIGVLRETVPRARARRPFHIGAWVVLPEHMHCIIMLPSSDDGYAKRIKPVKPSGGTPCRTSALRCPRWRSSDRVTSRNGYKHRVFRIIEAFKSTFVGSYQILHSPQSCAFDGQAAVRPGRSDADSR